MSFAISRDVLKLMSIESVMPSNHFILWCPLLLQPSIFPSIRVFSNELALCIRWPKHSRFRFSISPSDEYAGLISSRADWFVYLMHSEAKQAETSEFGAEGGLLQGHTRRTGGLCSKNSKLPEGFQQSIFKSPVGMAESRGSMSQSM